MSACKYWLSRHVHLCLSGNQVVLLDLHRNRYSTFDTADASPLSRLVAGWPSANAAAASAHLSEDEAAFRDLVHEQIVTTDRARGKLAMPLEFPAPAAELLEPRDLLDDFMTPRHAVPGRCRVAFLAAVAGAIAKRRCLSLERQVNLVTRRRMPATRSADELRVLVSTYLWLRPWGYMAKEQCLLDSLVLLDYLAWFGYYPFWVFGVRTAPFAAHCWVQAGSVVLNDQLSQTQEFTPILAA